MSRYMSMIFQALTWEARDVEDEHLISILGKTQDGKSVCVTTSFQPYFFVKLPPGTSKGAVEPVSYTHLTLPTNREV